MKDNEGNHENQDESVMQITSEPSPSLSNAKQHERKKKKVDPFEKYGDCYSSSWSKDSKSASKNKEEGGGMTKTKEKNQSSAIKSGIDNDKDEIGARFAHEPPDVIEIGEGSDKLVKVEVDEETPGKGKASSNVDEGGATQSHSSSSRKGKSSKSKRNIRIMESPSAMTNSTTTTFATPASSKPTKYYKPPKASGRSAFASPSSTPRDSYSTYAGSSSPATFRGLLRGVARLLVGSDEDLKGYKDEYSATDVSPDVRSAREASRNADRRAGRTKDLYSEENKKEWRLQCQMRAQERDIEYVRDMRVVYRSKAKDMVGDPIVTAIGAHYSKRMIPREDMLLHITKEIAFGPMNHKPYSLVYCHSNVELPKKPAVGFFKSLYVALGSEVCEHNIKCIYVVHPSPLLRTWILAFQLRVSPTLFKKVVYISTLKDLQKYIASPTFMDELPAHVLDCEHKT